MIASKGVRQMTLGERISQIRKEHGLSQEAFGADLGVSRQAISKWEADASIPDVDKLILISQTYHVSVGFLLGTEEEKTAEDLSEAQLKIVKEIVKQYIDALPKTEAQSQKHSKPNIRRRRLTLALAGVAAIALLIWCVKLSQNGRDLKNQYNNLESNIYHMQSTLNNQASQLAERMDEVLKKQNNLLSDYGYEITGADLAAGTLDIEVYLVPRSYTADLKAVLIGTSGEQSLKTNLTEGENHRFSGSISLALSDLITLSAELETKGKVENQTMGVISDELYASKFEAYAMGGNAIWNGTPEEAASGQLSEHISMDIQESVHNYRGNEVKLEKTELAVFVNGKKVKSCEGVWTEPLHNNGGAGYSFVFPVDLSLKEGDTIAYVSILSDNFGRQYSNVSDFFVVKNGVIEPESYNGDPFVQ
ncbi:MAG: helix-turn-helix transcriptional regulator [Oscillospiraceae bacterium]